jgi:hypothetical protein
MLALVLSSPVLAAERNAFELQPAQVAADSGEASGLMLAQADEEPMVERTEVESMESEEPALPISFGLSYALYSDYIFRAVNFSEYDGEGAERPNHQLTVSLAWDTGDFGTFGYDTWFEWYGGQQGIDPEWGGQNLQEVDYVIWWSYAIEQIYTDFTLGYTFYLFPNLGRSLEADGIPENDDNDRTQEWWFSLEHNDAWMWKWLWPDNEDGILNPSFFLAHDIGHIPGVWMEIGLSHEFTIPGVDNLTITPGWTLLIDGNYWQESGLELAGDQWALVVGYDLTPVLQLPTWAGSLSVTGELYFNNAWASMENDGIIQDEFWGGMTVNWSWGG